MAGLSEMFGGVAFLEGAGKGSVLDFLSKGLASFVCYSSKNGS